MKPEPLLVDDALWERIFELTDGAAALCYQCGVCTATCPWGIVHREPLSVRTFMRQAQLGLHGGDESLWLCTTCAQCEAQCPRGVNISDVFRSLRTIAWEQRSVAKGLPSMLWSVYWNGNPWSQPPSQRANWARNLDVPTFDPDLHEILLYAGCTSSYDRRAQKISRALVQILNTAGVRFGYLGEAEPCCGEAALSVGHKPYFEELALKAAGVFREKGVTRVVTVSPHSYDVFKNHYPAVRDGFQPIHYTQYLAQLVDEGRLTITDQLNRRITFHDPCYLGRHNDEYEAPRRVLSAIPGVEIVEMQNSRQDALCCGGGGGRMWQETTPGERFSDLRVQQAARTRADILATACPFCLVNLEDSVKAARLDGLRVMDVAEIVTMTLAGKTGEA